MCLTSLHVQWVEQAFRTWYLKDRAPTLDKNCVKIFHSRLILSSDGPNINKPYGVQSIRHCKTKDSWPRPYAIRPLQHSCCAHCFTLLYMWKRMLGASHRSFLWGEELTVSKRRLSSSLKWSLTMLSYSSGTCNVDGSHFSALERIVKKWKAIKKYFLEELPKVCREERTFKALEKNERYCCICRKLHNQSFPA